MTPSKLHDPTDETPYVDPDIAAALSGFSTAQIYEMLLGDPEAGLTPMIRGAMVRGRRLVELRDAIGIAAACSRPSAEDHSGECPF